MRKIEEAVEILESLGLPRAQQNERSALTLLALAGVGPRSSWCKCRQPLLRVWDIMSFMRDKYGKDYAANTRETIRRQTIHQFELRRCSADRVYVTAFLTRSAFRKYAADIAWESEVWIAESPDHMIHFNGPKFLGPFKVQE